LRLVFGDRSMNVLIVGNKGYLGSSLQSHLGKTFSCDGYDLSDRDWASKKIANTDVVVLCNGLSNHLEGQKNPQLDFERNVSDYLELINLNEIAGKKLLYLSSVCVYGTLHGDVTEEHPFQPREPQAIHKLLIEKHLEFQSRKMDFQFCTLRFGAVVGGKSSLENLSMLEKICECAIEKDPMILYGGEKRTYPYLELENFQEVVKRILRKDLFDNEVYHCPTQHLQMGDLVNLLTVEFQGAREDQPFRINSNKLEEKLGFKLLKSNLPQLVERLCHEIKESRDLS